MKSYLSTAGAVGMLALGLQVKAGAVSYVDWLHVEYGTGYAATVTGVITRPDSSTVTVTHTGEVVETTQITGGLNYWTTDVSPDPSPYLNDVISNLPAWSDLIGLGHDVHNTITFSEPVTNPIMLVLSLGRPDWEEVTYFFDAPFQILSSGHGHWGGDPAGSLFQADATTLFGVEGHGAIQFIGTFTTINWSVNWDEFWHGYTIALPDVAPSRVPERFGFAGLALAGLSLASFGAAMRRAKGM